MDRINTSGAVRRHRLKVRSIGLFLLLFGMHFGAAGAGAEEMKLTSPAFEEGGSIPLKYTCDGDDISPPLLWTGVPKNAAALALIVDDPEAPRGAFVHWVLYNIPVKDRGLPEGVTRSGDLGDGTMQGQNDFKETAYGGPCPRFGTHRYHFKLYALSSTLAKRPARLKSELLKAMEGRIIAEAHLTGTYTRQ